MGLTAERSHGVDNALILKADRPRNALIENQPLRRAVPPFLVQAPGMHGAAQGGRAAGGERGAGGGPGGFPRRGGGLPMRDARSHTDRVSAGVGRVNRDRAPGAGAVPSIRSGTGRGGRA